MKETAMLSDVILQFTAIVIAMVGQLCWPILRDALE